MGETIDKNKYLDFDGLKKYDELVKIYISSVHDALSDNIDSSLKGYVNEKVDEIKERISDLDTIRSGAAAGATALDDAKAYADGLAKNYDAAGSAAQALTDAKADAASLYQVKGDYEAAGTAAGLNDAMDKRVKVLEVIDHDKLAADASAAAVATVLDGAPDKFDTLKEVAQWIADSESATTAADLVTRVKALEDIDHNAYVAADELNLNAAKAYADTVAGNCDIKGAAAQALADAKTYVDGKLVFAEDADIDALFAYI